MPRYRVLELSYIGDRLHEAEAELDYDGMPGANLAPLDAAARKAVKAAAAIDARATAAIDAEEPAGEEAAPVDFS